MDRLPEERRHDNTILYKHIQRMIVGLEERILDKLGSKEESILAAVKRIEEAFVDKDLKKHYNWHKQKEVEDEDRAEIRSAIRKAFISWGLPIVMLLLILILKEPLFSLLNSITGHIPKP